jgi:hypothetical protein
MIRQQVIAVSDTGSVAGPSTRRAPVIMNRHVARKPERR